MLTRTAIRNLTHATFYGRGLDLYQQDKVKNLQVIGNAFEDRVFADVSGSGSKVYHVSFTYDRTRNMVTLSRCDCPAYSSYSGLCMHLVSGMLKYVDRKAAEESVRVEEALESGYAPEPVRMTGRKTSAGLIALMNRQTARRMAPLMQEADFGRIELEPTLFVEEGKVSAEFRVGAGHKYVLRDLAEFVKQIEGGQKVMYGQRLYFTHVLEAFAPQYRDMVQFLREWFLDNRENYLKIGGFLPGAARVRSILLSPAEVDRFMEAAEEIGFFVWIDKKEYGFCRQEGEHPPRMLHLTGVAGGLEMECKGLFGIRGSRNRFWFEWEKIYRESLEYLKPAEDFFDSMEQEPAGKVFIAEEDIPVFCRSLLPVLERYFEVRKTDFSENDYPVEEVSFEIYLDTCGKDGVSCRLIAVYGERRYNVYADREDMGKRDLNIEIPAAGVISHYCNAFDERLQAAVMQDSEGKMYEFLTVGIPKFQELGAVFISDALKQVKVARPPKVRVGVSLAGELLEISVETEGVERSQLLEILNQYDRRKKYYRLKNGDFIDLSGEGVDTLWELKKSLGLNEKQLLKEQIALPGYRAWYLDEMLVSRGDFEVQRQESFQNLIRRMQSVKEEEYRLPGDLSAKLREYQKEGFRWLKTLYAYGFGGILADDMGLGKTLQVIAFLCSEYETNPGRSLIVTPASLVYNWYNEFQKFAPCLPSVMIIGSASERQELLSKLPEQVILITSYDLLKRDMELYENTEFFCQVIDEAQNIKNHNTQASRSVKDIRARFKVALTGTPMENRLSELWSIFDYLMPGFLFGYERFREELEVPIVQEQDARAMERLKKMIRPFVLRRLKKDVLKDLPEKVEEDLYARMEEGQEKLYRAHVARMKAMLEQQTEEEFRRDRIQILAELTGLRQLCCDPSLIYEGYREDSAKVQMCMDLVRNAVSGGHRILLFSQFTSMLEILCGHLDREGIAYYTLTGSTTKEKRKELVEKFQRQEETVPVFCISLKAGGTGLNLTAADIVIHYDPWWNVAVQNQATDRAHRIGQKNSVTVYRLVTKDTIEENIIRLQSKKQDLAEAVLSGEGMEPGKLGREELLAVLGYGVL